MKLSVLFWNIWLENELQGSKHATTLLAELQRIVKTYQPDVIGLNEVLRGTHDETPFVIDYLKKLGYKYTHYVTASPFTPDWYLGTAVCSKYPLVDTADIVLGLDRPAQRRGYPGHTVKAIATHLKLGKGKTVGFIVAHPINLKPYTLGDHYKHTRALSQLIRMPAFSGDTIMGGDFNEPALFPGHFKRRHRALLHYRSGTITNPTWRHRAWQLTPVRANLDHLYWTKQGTLCLDRFEVIETDVSDHRPLFAKFETS